MNKEAVIRDLRRTRELLIPFFDFPADRLRKSYAPGKWTMRHILCHLVDAEVVFGARCRHILSEPGVPIPPFDQDRWAKTLVVEQRDLMLQRRLFNSLRESLIELVDLLPEAIFGRAGTHPERPSYRAWDVVTYASTHILHHFGQLAAIRDGQTWTPSNRAPEAPE
jgi:uncharacterized damage-inducible protein DinB